MVGQLALAARLAAASGHIIPAQCNGIVRTLQMFQLVELFALQTVRPFGGNGIAARYSRRGRDESFFGVI